MTILLDTNKEQGHELEKLRIRMLFKQGMVVQTMSMINAFIFVFLFKETIPTAPLSIWTACILIIFFLRISVQSWFNAAYSAKDRSFNPALWEQVFIAGTFLSGLAWAVAGTLLLPSENLAYRAFLGFLLAGNTAAAAVAYCTSILAIQAFLLPSVLPFAVSLLLTGGKYEYAMALLLISYVGVLSVLMKRMNHYVVDSIRLQFEKDHLLEELQITQSKVVHSAKMAALGIMAGGISHEINNPLAAIRFNSCNLRDLARANELEPQQAIEISDAIDSTIVRIAKIISGLKAFARDGKQEDMKVVPLTDIISETLEFCRARFQNHGVNLSVADFSSDLVVSCRRVQISQVLLNLLNNAFDAIQDQPDAWVKIEVYQTDDEVQIAVVDSGPGIPAELRDKLMQPFFTTKEVGKGTGLGLSITDGIMKSHGGGFYLDPSSTNTKFVFSLPVSTNQSLKAGAA